MAMRIRKGAAVLNADGERIGDVMGVAINPQDNEVTHLIVEKGFLFTTDKVLPIDEVVATSEEEIRLKEGIEHLDELPDYLEEHYLPEDQVTADENQRPTDEPAGVAYAPGSYWYPPADVSWWNAGNYPAGHATIPRNTEVPFVPHTVENIPEGTTALEEGAKVISTDGETVGSLEELFVDPQSGRATHMLVAKGLVTKERKAVPTWWISLVLGDEVHLSISADFVERLPDFD
jgi:uncharacterized protein YrrD